MDEEEKEEYSHHRKDLYVKKKAAMTAEELEARNTKILLNCRHSQWHGSRARAVVVVLTVVSQGG